MLSLWSFKDLCLIFHLSSRKLRKNNKHFLQPWSRGSNRCQVYCWKELLRIQCWCEGLIETFHIAHYVEEKYHIPDLLFFYFIENNAQQDPFIILHPHYERKICMKRNACLNVLTSELYAQIYLVCLFTRLLLKKSVRFVPF